MNEAEIENFTTKQLTLKEEINSEISKNSIKNEILEVYPITKQIDIIARINGYTDNDFLEMKRFIEEKTNKIKFRNEQVKNLFFFKKRLEFYLLGFENFIVCTKHGVKRKLDGFIILAHSATGKGFTYNQTVLDDVLTL